MVIHLLASASASAAKAAIPAVAGAASSVVTSAVKSAASSVVSGAAKAVVSGVAAKVSYSRQDISFRIVFSAYYSAHIQNIRKLTPKMKAIFFNS